MLRQTWLYSKWVDKGRIFPSQDFLENSEENPIYQKKNEKIKKKSTSFRTEQIIRTQGEHFSTENFLSFASDLPVIRFYNFGVLVPPFVIYLWYRYKGADSWKCSLLPRLIPHVLGGASPVKTSKKPSSRYRPKEML